MWVDCECACVHCTGPSRWTCMAVLFGPPSSAFTLVPHLLLGRIQLVLLHWCRVLMIFRRSCGLLAKAIMHVASTFIGHFLDSIIASNARISPDHGGIRVSVPGLAWNDVDHDGSWSRKNMSRKRHISSITRFFAKMSHVRSTGINVVFLPSPGKLLQYSARLQKLSTILIFLLQPTFSK